MQYKTVKQQKYSLPTFGSGDKKDGSRLTEDKRGGGVYEPPQWAKRGPNAIA